MYTVAALYHFTKIDQPNDLREQLFAFCEKHQMKGILLIAQEGINGTVAGSAEAIEEFLKHVKQDRRFSALESKLSFSETMPFYRLKVRVKQEIVTLRRPEVDPTEKVGVYVDAKDWNDLISDPDVLLIDTRNDYEFKIGTFKNAINPNTKNFVEFPDFVQKNLDPKKHKKVAMFCTGGIRCEKASAYMLQAGFENVYHLKGGILKYLEEVRVEESLWHGNCFVFDQRVSVGHGLAIGDNIPCYGCRTPLTPDERLSKAYKEGVSCPYCIDQVDENSKMRKEERQRQVDLAKGRQTQHIGITQKRHLKALKSAVIV